MSRCLNVLCLGTVVFVFAAAAQSSHTCAQAASFRIAGFTVQITKATPVAAAAGIPAHCRVDGDIDPRTGFEGKPYAIGFALALPDSWNGRFLFQGGGGLNGTVANPTGANASGSTPALARGFAVVSTDSGHKGQVFDPSFMRDQQAALDFYYQAIGKVRTVAKDFIAWYYGRPAAHSYYDGCSTGGREAMIMSQRYPTDFDGIVAGDPAIRTGYSNLALGYIASVFAKAGPEPFSESDRKLIVQSLLAKCDKLDGLADGMIFNVRGCGFDPAALQCSGAKNDTCLSTAQVQALHLAFAGPKNQDGDPYYPGPPYDAGIDESAGFIPGILRGPRIPVQTGADAAHFNVDREAARVAASGGALLGDSTVTNLTTFQGHGGKLIFYHGLSDPWFSPYDTLEYYEKLETDTPGPAPLASWSRLFLVPGMGHCGGGSATLDRFDMLTAIVDWVEKNQAPARVNATGAAFPGRTRPLCPYPKYAHYNGTGDPNDAASFTCRE